ncbi:MAG: YabP/YqfC family sporulation protein [Clostridia bacterium]|nr:YabP/YqfC family sporulation protein [Clostridia bacterium]
MLKSLKRIIDSPERRRGELVQIYSRRAVYIEGVRRVVRLTDTEILLEASCSVRVCGGNLVLRQLGDSCVCAEGRIDSVGFPPEPC